MRVRGWLLACLLIVTSSGAAAQSLEGALIPGKVIAGHAKYEDDCGACHVRFDRAAQDRLCRDCHKEVSADVAARRGLHGRHEQKPCRSCHTDHKGRDVNIAPLDEKAFDHGRTDFALRGAHAKVACKSCHVPGRKHRAAPQACADCHRADDKHRGSLGVACADCHGEANWKDAKFDHGRTRFPLTFGHDGRRCADCHRDLTFKGAPTACVGCHRADDKQHRGRLGDKCDACHGTRDWTHSTFSHDRDTRYALKGKHRPAKCESCHTAPPAREKPPTACAACHRRDDKHAGTLGNACADCHVESGWRETRIDHDRTRFPLLGKHHDVECRDCHRDVKAYRITPTDCLSCHGKDDTHKGRYGSRCERCHDAFDWRRIAFRHDRDTRYPLKGRHAAVKCDSCHGGRLYEDKLATDCIACHRKDDTHKNELGERCAQCHDESTWKVGRFDHGRTRFALIGAHARLECRSCHKGTRYREAPLTCIGCHERDDKHERTLGRDCARCHNVRDWRIWEFDHRRTRFALDGAHVPVTCRSCHRTAGDPIPAVPMACASCHGDDDVHRGEYGAVCERCHATRSWREIKGLGRRTDERRGPDDGAATRGGRSP
jgi:hypothetical protein